MLSKNQLKEIRALHISKYRRQEKSFIVEGPKVVNEFINSHYNVKKIFALKEWTDANSHLHNDITLISPKELQAISLLKTPNQVVAIVSYPDQKEFNYDKNDLVIALDSIQDPGNLGTIIRIADWFGIDKLVCSKETADAYNPKVVQASMGALTRVKFCYTDLAEWMSKIDSNTPIYGTLLKGENIYETNLSKNGIIIIGNEGNGISPEIKSYIKKAITIPSYGDSMMESLNAAVATAIVCAEFRRR
jgi:TrmH family RNA methyltransferase